MRLFKLDVVDAAMADGYVAALSPERHPYGTEMGHIEATDIITPSFRVFHVLLKQRRSSTTALSQSDRPKRRRPFRRCAVESVPCLSQNESLGLATNPPPSLWACDATVASGGPAPTSCQTSCCGTMRDRQCNTRVTTHRTGSTEQALHDRCAKRGRKLIKYEPYPFVYRLDF